MGDDGMVRLSSSDEQELRRLAAELLGDGWMDEDPAAILAQLVLTYGDPVEVADRIGDALREDGTRYSEDATVDEIIRTVLERHEGAVGLQSFNAIVRGVARVRQRSTVKRYVQDAVRDGPLRPDPDSINRFIIEPHGDEAPRPGSDGP